MYFNKAIVIIGLLVIYLLPLETIASSTEDKSKKENQVYSGKQTQEWQEIQTKLLAVKGKLEQQEVLVKGLIESKQATTGGGHKGTAAVSEHEKMATLNKEHRKLLALAKEYNELRNQFNLRFPEKNSVSGRIYKRVDPSTLEELESQMTFEGRLKRVERKIKEQYPKSIRPTKPVNQDSQISDPAKTSPAKKEVTDSIILKK